MTRLVTIIVAWPHWSDRLTLLCTYCYCTGC